MTHMTLRHGRSANYRHMRARPGEFYDSAALQRFAPAVFAEHAHGSRSSRYAFTPTTDILSAIQSAGLVCTSAQVQHVKNATREGFQKHLLRFSLLRDVLNPDPHGERFEVVSVNAHDGTASNLLALGAFRMICENGLMSGDISHHFKITHTGGEITRERVREAAQSLVAMFPAIREKVQGWKEITLNRDEYQAFGQSAALLRWDDEQYRENTSKIPVRIDELMTARHVEDTRDAASNAVPLWTAYNVAQEALIRGGTRTRTVNAKGQVRRSHAREITGIDQNTALNRALWNLTQHMATLKGAA